MRTSKLVTATILGLGLVLALTWALGSDSPARAAPVAERQVCLSGCVYTSIQDAVDASDPGDVIKVAAGLYTGVQAREGVTQVVYISKTVTIQGGYTTAFAEPPDPGANQTTLDAQGQGRVIFITGQGITVSIQGLHVTGGNATGVGGAWSARPDSGGGIHVVSSTLALADNWIYNNIVPGNGDGFGGGILFYFGKSATLTGNAIYSNSATFSGGAHFLGSAPVRLTDNRVFNNGAVDYVGGVALNISVGATLEGNRIYSNTAGSGVGGIYINGCTDATLRNNQVYDNNGGGHSGGISLISSRNITLTNTVVAGNRLTGGGDGTGIQLYDSDVHLLHTTLAQNSGGKGQGVYAYNNSTLWMTNTILVSHTVGVEATADSTATLQGTLWGVGSWANLTDTAGSTVFTGSVNVWGDPAFVNPTAWDYHLTAGSAAIDAGVEASVATDIDGDPRSNPPDVGADEVARRVYLPLVMRN